MKFIYFTVLSLSLCLNTARASQEKEDQRIKKISSSSDLSQITIHPLPYDAIGEIIGNILSPRDAISFLMTCKAYYNYEILNNGEQMNYISIMRYNDKFLSQFFKYNGIKLVELLPYKLLPYKLLASIKRDVGNPLSVYNRARAFKENESIKLLPRDYDYTEVKLYRSLFFLLSQDKVKSFKGAIQDNKFLFDRDMYGDTRAEIILGLAQGGLTEPEIIEQFSQAIHNTAGLFTNDMRGFERALIIAVLARWELTIPEAIQAVAGLFTNDMHQISRLMIIGALGRARLTTPEAIEAIYNTGLITDDMDGYARADIISRLARSWADDGLKL